MNDSANLTARDLMQLHIQTLFCLDARGRLRCINEFGNPPAPIFYMGRTLEGNFWHFRHNIPLALVDELDDLCRAEPVVSHLGVSPQNEAEIRSVIEEFFPHHQQSEYCGPAYWIPETKPVRSNVVLLSRSNSELLQETFPWLLPLLAEQDVGPVAAAVEDGAAVALCFCSRRPGRAVEAGVETLPAFRSKGYATATVAAWAEEVYRRSVIPLYSTSWDNLASQAVARKLDMVMYGEDWSIQ